MVGVTNQIDDNTRNYNAPNILILDVCDSKKPIKYLKIV